MEIIKLKSGSNFRDLGGIKIANGQILPTRKYFRGKSLFGLKEKDIKCLVQDYGLKTVIDLRTAQERDEKPNPQVPGLTFINMPIFNEATAGITKEYGTKKLGALKKMTSMADLYRSMAEEDEWLDNLAAVVNKILSLKEDQLPVLFHCSVGKDRTGIITALLLYYFGASEEDIIKDYLYTNKSGKAKRILARPVVFAKFFSFKIANKAVSSLRADVRYFNAFFDALKKKYGSIENFLDQKISPEN